jgi:putative membrane protein insertion efficiency factor
MSAAGKTIELVRGMPAGALILLVRVYQYTLSPLMGLIGVQCRFQPTCSQYFIGAVQKHGACRGAWRGVLRLARCHPFHPGGYDPP